MLTAPRVLVLGGTGYLGSHICAEYRRAGFEVVAVARQAGQAVRTVVLDLATTPVGRLRSLLLAERPSVVVNAAGAVWGELTAGRLRAANVGSVESLLAAAAGLPWRPRLVHLGSIYEYGPVPAGTPITERVECRPASEYAKSKLQASRLVLAASRAGRVDAVVLRVSTIIGVGAPPQSLLGGVTRELAEAVRDDRRAVVELPGSADPRDFLDVRDLASGVCAAAGAPVTGRVLNLARGRSVSPRELVARLVEISGVPAELRSRRIADGSAALRGGPGGHDVDPAEAMTALDWRPRYRHVRTLRAIWQAAGRAATGTRELDARA